MNTVVFDHAVIYVPHLEQAVRQFTALGFTVQLGGEHHHTCNALIIFNDQSYIELLALKPSWRRPLLLLAARLGWVDYLANSKKDISWRLLPWIVKRYGAIDWCVRTVSIDKTLKRLATTDIPILKSQSYERTRPDGTLVKWLLGGAQDLDLPYLIEDKTTLNVRVPLGVHTSHPNGAMSLRQINVSSIDTSRTARALSTLLNSSIIENKKDNLMVALDKAMINLTEQSNLIGKFSLELEYNGDEPKLLDSNKTYGAEIRLVPKLQSEIKKSGV